MLKFQKEPLIQRTGKITIHASSMLKFQKEPLIQRTGPSMKSWERAGGGTCFYFFLHGPNPPVSKIIIFEC
jgi:hypothetical protein